MRQLSKEEPLNLYCDGGANGLISKNRITCDNYMLYAKSSPPISLGSSFFA
jgi:hypothetical protein